MVTGWVAPGWEPVRDALVRGCADDPGAAQLAVHHHGRLVVDLAAGPPGFGTDSAGVLMSVTKGLVAVCAHLLSERGALDLQAPVARYWPEFAAAGKAGTTVADLLTHRAGLPAFSPGPAGCGLPGLYDWDARVEALAAMRPVWEPGRASLYHALTYGHLAGEVVRRVSGRSIGAFFADEVAGPLGLDLWIGLPAAQEHRFVPQFSVRPDPTPEQVAGFLAGLGLAPDAPLSLALRASQAELAASVEGLTTREGRAAELPGAGGIGNARSLSRLYAALIGSVDGVRLLSPKTLERAVAPRDDVPPPPPLDGGDPAGRSRFGLGFELPRRGLPMLGEGSFGHAGAGGRLGMADPGSGLAVGFVCTAMAWEPAAGPDPRWAEWTEAVTATAAAL
ncbi:CubicO group peptidase, beta-lactamase class C family [Streptomyces sp. 2131.1]|uniref:serine hydrolase domain-containing protein n=1 Tax=Streptomyces sp. 2131.1 TaxID=1855346 RepID=UPI00089D4E3B|nr:serine hydrolase domain-containing protein [Streptomyces sp. 2131.1]SEC07140.1 CubicO group peptidase, beta-lactamase class C family [Streptomyces sp. 2131.1]